MPNKGEWRCISIKKKLDRENSLAKYDSWRIKNSEGLSDVSSLPLRNLTERERDIVHCDATALLDRIRNGVHSCVEVFTAFAKATVVAQDTTNCLSEIFIDDGFIVARELDNHFKETGKTIGPLHGLPVSIKDHIKVKGLDTATGYIGWAYNRYADRDAVVVEILRQAGAVLFVKTQNPQTLLSLETNNNIYGATVNPFNIKLTPGGSSGGEGALIACQGSCMGIGTDIGGSIRIPAAHCGLYGLKASVARLPHAGLVGSHDGMDAIVGSLGPLAKSARDLQLFCQVVLDAKPWLLEPSLLEMPWQVEVARGKQLPQRLSIAILADDGVVAPHPPITDALQRCRKQLLDAGHDVIDWLPLDHQAGWDLIVKLYFLDGGIEYYETLQESGEPPVPETEWIMKQIERKEPCTPSEIFRLNLEREALRHRALVHWNATEKRTNTGRPVDAILCPVAPTLAPPLGTTAWWSYTSHWNLLDLPAVVFPIGRFSSLSQNHQPLTTPRNDVEESIHAQWDPVTYDNAPISLQLVGRRHNEERLLAILDAVEKAWFKGHYIFARK